MQKMNPLTVLTILAACLILAACTSPAETPTALLDASPTASPTRVLATKLPDPSRCPAESTLRPAAARTALPTGEPVLTGSTPAATAQPVRWIQIGTPLPPLEVISAENVERLQPLAQWGRGRIAGAAFSADGQSFAVGSAYGVALYSTTHPDAQPVWHPFPEPHFYDSLYFSQDGAKHLLERESSRQMFVLANDSFSTGEEVGEAFRSTGITETFGGSIVSKDGFYRLEHNTFYDPEDFRKTTSVREVYDQPGNRLLFALTDNTIHVTYEDRHSPLGCDLDSFSYCGNVYDPLTMSPYRVGFSPARDTFAILYRASEMYDSNHYSVMRVYDLHDGRLLHSIGSFDHPVETFAYSPDGHTLLIGHVDGRVELRSLPDGQNRFSSQHFNDRLLAVSYTLDGRFVVLQRPDVIELRSTVDGSVHARYAGVNYTLSPVRNWIAIGDEDGSLHVEDLDTGKTVYRVQAHTERIFALAFSPDGKELVTSGQDCDVRAWEGLSGKFLHLFEENWTNAYEEEWTNSRIFIYSLNFIPGLDRLIGFGSWGRVAGWDTDHGGTSYLIEPEKLEYYNGMMTLNPHFPEFFGVNGSAGTFSINQAEFEAATGEYIPDNAPAEESKTHCISAGPGSVDGSLRFNLGYDEMDGRICIREKGGKAVQTLNVIPQDMKNNLWLEWVYLAPDGRQLAVSTSSGAVLVYGVPRE